MARLAMGTLDCLAMSVLVQLGRHVGIASLAGAIAGVAVGGLLGRVAMRVSGFMAGPEMVGVPTSAGERVGNITFEGTLALIFFTGIPTGLLGGVLYAGVEPWLRRLRPWHGLVFGIGLLVAASLSVLEPTNFDFVRFGSAPLNVVMFAALFVLFGVASAWLFEGLRGVAAGNGTVANLVGGAAWITLLPASAATLAALIGIETGPTSYQLPQMLLAGALAVAIFVHWRGLPRPIGYAALAVPMVAGVFRFAETLRRILE